MKRNKGVLGLLILFAGLIGVSEWKVNAAYQNPYPLLSDLVISEHLPADLGALFLGTRSVAVDIAYIQFLQYYGIRKGKDAYGGDVQTEEGIYPDDGHDHGGHAELISYPRTLQLGLRMIRLDPYFHKGILEVAGTLAFNLKRTDEALELLRDAIHHDPKFYRYRLYAAAILYQEEGSDDKTIALLEQAIQFPECPPLLENVLGNLLAKKGHPKRAIEVYLHTFQTAPYESDRQTALNNILKLIEKRPELKPFVASVLPN